VLEMLILNVFEVYPPNSEVTRSWLLLAPIDIIDVYIKIRQQLSDSTELPTLVYTEKEKYRVNLSLL